MTESRISESIQRNSKLNPANSAGNTQRPTTAVRQRLCPNPGVCWGNMNDADRMSKSSEIHSKFFTVTFSGSLWICSYTTWTSVWGSWVKGKQEVESRLRLVSHWVTTSVFYKTTWENTEKTVWNKLFSCLKAEGEEKKGGSGAVLEISETWAGSLLWEKASSVLSLCWWMSVSRKFNTDRIQLK